jgi:Na+-driven multidrug efflux pump
MSGSPVIAELRATVALAAPLAATNVTHLLMGLTDTIRLGRLHDRAGDVGAGDAKRHADITVDQHRVERRVDRTQTKLARKTGRPRDEADRCDLRPLER